MKKLNLTLIFFFISSSIFSQVYNSHATVPVQQDTVIQWAAESNKVINVTPKANGISLKKWYLDRIKNSTVNAYRKKGNFYTSYPLSMPGLQTQDWLKGLSIELSPHRFPQEWFFFDKSLPADDYNRYKARVRNLNLAADSCCGCDDADAFRARQIVTYKNGRFNIHNVFISPLCARQTATPPAEWYPLCNVAYNDNTERKFPGLSKDVVLLNTNELEYDFNTDKPSAYDSVYTSYRTDIGNLLYQDILLGNFKPVDVETSKSIPVRHLLTIGMPADTVVVYDPDDRDKILSYRVLQQQKNPRDFSRIRIEQELYFDFKNERMYSVIKSVTLMKVFYAPDGKTIRGAAPFCRLEIQ